MSRVGKRVINIPEGVEVIIDGQKVVVKGPKGSLERKIHEALTLAQKDNELVLTCNDPLENAIYGTTNSLISNMVEGVSTGFKKELESVGVGYRFKLDGKTLEVHAGFSHPVIVNIPDDIDIELKSNTEIILTSADKERLGLFASNIRKIRKPEPYKGKGIRYKGEHIRRKEGKKVA